MPAAPERGRGLTREWALGCGPGKGNNMETLYLIGVVCILFVVAQVIDYWRNTPEAKARRLKKLNAKYPRTPSKSRGSKKERS
jgi:hypothetical protein